MASRSLSYVRDGLVIMLGILVFPAISSEDALANLRDYLDNYGKREVWQQGWADRASLDNCISGFVDMEKQGHGSLQPAYNTFVSRDQPNKYEEFESCMELILNWSSFEPVHNGNVPRTPKMCGEQCNRADNDCSCDHLLFRQITKLHMYKKEYYRLGDVARADKSRSYDPDPNLFLEDFFGGNCTAMDHMLNCDCSKCLSWRAYCGCPSVTFQHAEPTPSLLHRSTYTPACRPGYTTHHEQPLVCRDGGLYWDDHQDQPAFFGCYAERPSAMIGAVRFADQDPRPQRVSGLIVVDLALKSIANPPDASRVALFWGRAIAGDIPTRMSRIATLSLQPMTAPSTLILGEDWPAKLQGAFAPVRLRHQLEQEAVPLGATHLLAVPENLFGLADDVWAAPVFDLEVSALVPSGLLQVEMRGPGADDAAAAWSFHLRRGGAQAEDPGSDGICESAAAGATTAVSHSPRRDIDDLARWDGVEALPPDSQDAVVLCFSPNSSGLPAAAVAVLFPTASTPSLAIDPEQHWEEDVWQDVLVSNVPYVAAGNDDLFVYLSKGDCGTQSYNLFKDYSNASRAAEGFATNRSQRWRVRPRGVGNFLVCLRNCRQDADCVRVDPLPVTVAACQRCRARDPHRELPRIVRSWPRIADGLLTASATSRRSPEEVSMSMDFARDGSHAAIAFHGGLLYVDLLSSASLGNSSSPSGSSVIAVGATEGVCNGRKGECEYLCSTPGNCPLRVGSTPECASTQPPELRPPLSCGDGGPASKAIFMMPVAVRVAPSGLFWLVVDAAAHRIRRVDLPPHGTVRTVAGSGQATFAVGKTITLPAYSEASMGEELRLLEGAFRGDGNAAVEARLNLPWDVAISEDDAEFIIADRMNNRVRRVRGGIISTVAGREIRGSACEALERRFIEEFEGLALQTALCEPVGVEYLPGDSGAFVVAERSADRLRYVMGPTIRTLVPAQPGLRAPFSPRLARSGDELLFTMACNEAMGPDSYQGCQTRTFRGEPCLPWSDERVKEKLERSKAEEMVAVTSILKSKHCQGRQVLNASSGYFGQVDYANNQYCEWLIPAGPESAVRLTFLHFDLEEHYDWLELFDVSGVDECFFSCEHAHDLDNLKECNSSEARWRASYGLKQGCRHTEGRQVGHTGNKKIAPYREEAGSLLVTFMSDASQTRSGFKIFYEIVPRHAPAVPPPISYNADLTSNFCRPSRRNWGDSTEIGCYIDNDGEVIWEHCKPRGSEPQLRSPLLSEPEKSRALFSVPLPPEVARNSGMPTGTSQAKRDGATSSAAPLAFVGAAGGVVDMEQVVTAAAAVGIDSSGSIFVADKFNGSVFALSRSEPECPEGQVFHTTSQRWCGCRNGTYPLNWDNYTEPLKCEECPVDHVCRVGFVAPKPCGQRLTTAGVRGNFRFDACICAHGWLRDAKGEEDEDITCRPCKQALRCNQTSAASFRLQNGYWAHQIDVQKSTEKVSGYEVFPCKDKQTCYWNNRSQRFLQWLECGCADQNVFPIWESRLRCRQHCALSRVVGVRAWPRAAATGVDSCLGHRDGFACGRCKDGYIWRGGGRCVSCTSALSWIMLFADVLGWLWLLLIFYTFLNQPQGGRFMATYMLTQAATSLVVFLQEFNLLSTIFPLIQVPFLRDILALIPSFDVTMLSFRCLTGVANKSPVAYLWSLLLPLFIVSGFFFLLLILRLTARVRKKLPGSMTFGPQTLRSVVSFPLATMKNGKLELDKVLNTLGFLTCAIYIDLTKLAFAAFLSNPESGRQAWWPLLSRASEADDASMLDTRTPIRYPDVIMYTLGGDWLAGDRLSMVPLALAATFVYTVTIFAFHIKIAIQTPQRFLASPSFRNRFKYFFAKYREDRYWWTIVCMTKALLLNIGAAFGSSVTVNGRTYNCQIPLAFVVMVSFFVGSLTFRPYKVNMNSHLESALQLALIFMLAGKAATQDLPMTQLMFITIAAVLAVLLVYLLSVMVYRLLHREQRLVEISQTAWTLCIFSERIADVPEPVLQKLFSCFCGAERQDIINSFRFVSEIADQNIDEWHLHAREASDSSYSGSGSDVRRAVSTRITTLRRRPTEMQANSEADTSQQPVSI
eukprot:TRINITY_DN22522_c0_g1_i1.p1 TRINITY_DN22522_c0_g1~~TRINITY_DN22522_c0_g1_i1.p1  ORF type:complete len:2111 (+),score=367.32 TRINITY_DN22522_c0_g1_i1:75-6335(+)